MALQPWTGRSDLAGLQIIRTASYTFRARLASRFRAGRVFLLGDAAHLTPPFIGQGLAVGLRDAGNLAWKLAYVLTGRAGADLLASYDTERRPHAKALVTARRDAPSRQRHRRFGGLHHGPFG